jgi:hypothetical protein
MTEMFKFSECCNNLRRLARSLGSSEQLESRPLSSPGKFLENHVEELCLCLLYIHVLGQKTLRKNHKKNIKSSICVGTNSIND